MKEIINVHTHDGTRRTFEIKKGWVYFYHSEKPMRFFFKAPKEIKIANFKFKIHFNFHAQKGTRLYILIRNPLFQLDKHNWGFNFSVGKREIMYNQI